MSRIAVIELLNFSKSISGLSKLRNIAEYFSLTFPMFCVQTSECVCCSLFEHRMPRPREVRDNRHYLDPESLDFGGGPIICPRPSIDSLVRFCPHSFLQEGIDPFLKKITS